MIFKQYGAMRTGTNAVRALTEANFADTRVLMHVLGDKHSAPVDFDDLHAAVRDAADPAWEFVSRATWMVPAIGGDRQSVERLAYLRSIAEAVFESYRSNQLGFLVSVRDPYSWAYSLIEYKRWYRRRYRTILQPVLAHVVRPSLQRHLRIACGELNLNIRAWLALRDRYPSRTAIIRVEDLTHHPLAVLQALQRQFNLVWRSPEPSLDSGSLAPTIWDDKPMRRQPANRAAVRQAAWASFEPIAELVERVLAEDLDWGLMAVCGYAPRSGTGADGVQTRSV